METAVILAILAGIVIFSLRGCWKRVRHGCCGSGREQKKIRPADRDRSHFPCVYEAEVDGMKCRGCVIRVENAFHERGGFLAKADLKKKRVVVRSASPVPEEKLKEIIQKSGYSVRSLKTLCER